MRSEILDSSILISIQDKRLKLDMPVFGDKILMSKSKIKDSTKYLYIRNVLKPGALELVIQF